MLCILRGGLRLKYTSAVHLNIEFISFKAVYIGEKNLEKFIIKGGRRLQGEVEISGAKNAAVAIIPATILSDEPCVLENVPNISDVSISLRILYEMGADVKFIGKIQ